MLLLDEPEHHLDPPAVARLLASLVRPDLLGPRGQIWLATRSPAVIDAAHATRVLLVEDGHLRWSAALDRPKPPPSPVHPSRRCTRCTT